MTLRILQAITSVRVGDGTSIRSIDLPVARERHTRWPFLPGSALKGALRARATIVVGADREARERVFGTDPPAEDRGDADALHPGSLRVGPAILLALPVRAIHRTFVLLTCPTALARFGRTVGDAPPLPVPEVHEALLASDRTATRTRVQLGSRAAGIAFVEDLDLVGIRSDRVAPWTELLGRWVGEHAPLDRLVVVHDDVFAHACDAWTEIRTRNEVEPDGIVKEGSLFDVEMLPAETLWWVATHGDDGGLLPADGELFTVGGHQGVGLGRVAWYGEAPCTG